MIVVMICEDAAGILRKKVLPLIRLVVVVVI